MRTWALVPAKRFAGAKSRLGGALDDGARTRLAQSLLDRALSVVAGCELQGVLVATDGDDVARFARARGAHVLRDAPHASLARVIDEGIESLAARGATHVVVLLGDLPRIAPDDVRSLVRSLCTADVVVAPDRHGEGTNALGVATSIAYPTSFGGGDSFGRHRTRARERGLRLAVQRSDALGLDLDVEGDLLRYDLGASLSLGPTPISR